MTRTVQQMMDEANANTLKDVTQDELQDLIARFDEEIVWGQKWFDPNTTEEERLEMCKDKN